MDRTGLEYLTLFGAHPLQFIEAAGAAGCGHVSLLMAQSPFSPPGSPPYSLVDDARLRRDTVSCLNTHGISIGLVDGLLVLPDQSVSQYRPCFDVMAELGVTRVNAVSFDGWERTVDEVAAMVIMAAEYDVMVTIETCPVNVVSTVAKGLELIATIGLPNVKLLVDTMHVSRSGDSSLVATMDPELIEYVQVSDAPLMMPATAEAYMDEAMYERAVPGEGELPLVEILRNIGPEVIVSAEVPMQSRRRAGMTEVELARLALEGTRRLLALAAA